MVAQVVSWAKALQTGQWSAPDPRLAEPEFDIAQIERCLAWLQEDRAGWEHWFRAERIEPFAISYETLIADMEGVTLDALEFLGLRMPEGSRLDPGPIRRQGDAVNAEWAARYRELTGLAPDEQPAFS